MSDSRTPDDAGGALLSETLSSVSKLDNKLKGAQTGKETGQSSSTSSPACKGENLQTPKRTPCSRYICLNSCESPGDGEASQDIIWDPTSPKTGNGPRNIQTVEISDIVNRIAPKDVKLVATESPLLQWIGDSAIPYTPENSQPRVRKRPLRQNNVEGLIKLARQFDKMQQDEKTLEKPKTVNNNICEQISETKCVGIGHPGYTGGAKSLPSTSQQVEAELNELFDSSPQQITGHFSQSSSCFSCSQEKKGQPGGGSTSTAPQSSELKSVKNYTDANTCLTEHQGTFSLNVNKHEFDDDWEDDDLLNDSFVLAMTHNSEQQQDAVPKTTPQLNARLNSNQDPSACKPRMSACSAFGASSVQSQPHCSAHMDVIPKPKTSKRSTFQLESNLHFQAKLAAANDVPGFSVMEPYKSQIPDQKSAVMKPVSLMAVDTSKMSTVTSDQINRRAGSAVKDHHDKVESFVDCLWDDWDDDDQLFYQVCDNLERTCNNKTMKAVADANLGIQMHTVAARLPQNSKSHHASFKRHQSDPGAISKKVFVTGQMTGKCSAAEIEKKKQEALARRRLRTQSLEKP
ncbi:ewing's tumor-associated antigen 1 homolog [Lampris incognitus]|uniref:ewing's tumor-associated antigen 1 homolog n=1 Tax=Lampris incognitus TaxID=2546036 RepID=UPI0024B59F20|nr:ewing's tumor-associated antigen 1 homolog [Lampris incognitus]